MQLGPDLLQIPGVNESLLLDRLPTRISDRGADLVMYVQSIIFFAENFVLWRYYASWVSHQLNCFDPDA